MADTNPGGVVATISTAKLIELWGPTITIKRSKRENAKFPLYLAPNTGPVHLNNASGQDFLLDHGAFKGAGDSPEFPIVSPETPGATPEPPRANPQTSRETPGAVTREPAGKKQGATLLDWLGEVLGDE